MIDYITHYYDSQKGPFRSLSELSDEEAIRIMEALCDDTPYGARFKDPLGYLKNRKETERWVRQGFIAKGGRPLAPYPIPFVLGWSKWLEDAAPNPDRHAEIRIPLSEFAVEDVSFTYTDSMLSHWFSRDKPAEYYQPALHGIIFTLPEILAIVEQNGMPEEDWESNLPADLAPYIEAQVWNHAVLEKYRDEGD